MEEEPILRLQYGDGELDVRRDNSRLYTFAGELACHNHVYVQIREGHGHFLFRGEGFERIVEFMLSNGYEATINAREVPKCDLDAYDKYIGQQVQDVEYVPDDWKLDSEG